MYGFIKWNKLYMKQQWMYGRLIDSEMLKNPLILFIQMNHYTFLHFVSAMAVHLNTLGLQFWILLAVFERFCQATAGRSNYERPVAKLHEVQIVSALTNKATTGCRHQRVRVTVIWIFTKITLIMAFVTLKYLQYQLSFSFQPLLPVH